MQTNTPIYQSYVSVKNAHSSLLDQHLPELNTGQDKTSPKSPKINNLNRKQSSQNAAHENQKQNKNDTSKQDNANPDESNQTQVKI
jgi:hypothetical protein